MSDLFRLRFIQPSFLDDFMCLAYFFGYSFCHLFLITVMSYLKWWEAIEVLSWKRDF